MFAMNSVHGVEVSENAPYTQALVAKLVDIDANRIAKSDELVLRKAVLGLIEIVAQLEERLASLEPQEVSARWAEGLAEQSELPTPDQVRLAQQPHVQIHEVIETVMKGDQR
jgi:hypothetical protein